MVREAAATELGDKEVPDHEPDPDWTARFFDWRPGCFLGGHAEALGEGALR